METFQLKAWERMQLLLDVMVMEYEKIINKYDNRGKNCIGNIERFAFYEEAKKGYAIIATSEKALYANIMLQKGVVVGD